MCWESSAYQYIAYVGEGGVKQSYASFMYQVDNIDRSVNRRIGRDYLTEPYVSARERVDT